MKQRRTELVSTVALLVSLLTVCLAFSTTYRIDTPDGTDDPSEGDDRMREAKLATQERLDVDHYWTPSAANIYDDPNTGKHRFVTYAEPNNITSVVAGEGATFTKDTNDIPELHWIDDEDNVLQLTQEGRFYLGTNNVYLRVDNAAADGYVDLIKADTDDEPVLQDGAALASTADPNEDTDIAHKKYVDDQIDVSMGQSDRAIGTTNITSGSNDWADMADMEIVMTTKGGNVLVMFNATFESYDDTEILGLRFDLDDSPYATQQQLIRSGLGAAEAQDHCVAMQYLFTSLAAGEHTFKVQWDDVLYNVKQDGTDFPRILTVIELPS